MQVIDFVPRHYAVMCTSETSRARGVVGRVGSWALAKAQVKEMNQLITSRRPTLTMIVNFCRKFMCVVKG